MFRYTIVQAPSCHLDTWIIDNIFKNISKYISLPQEGTINIICVSQKEIQELNNTYRWKNSTTDVLSFHYFDDFWTLESNEIAGEIVLCEEKVIQWWVEYGLWTEKEFYKLIIHASLHLLGYDHEEEQDYKNMQAQEDKIWSEVFEK